MRISLNWLRDYIDIKDDVDIQLLAQQMTSLGLEIEAIERPGDEIDKVYVGEILAIDKHPDADKIVVCKTDVGQGDPLQICCGAKNMKVGDRVPTVIVGGTLPGGFKIGRRKLRGIESQGMMCSAKELGLGEDHDGLLILDPNAPKGADAVNLLGLDDVIFDIEVIPNRGDWASMIGVARELGALYGKTITQPAITLKEDSVAAADLSSITLQAPELCPRYIGVVLSNVKVGPSPTWLCQRLIAAGQRPINNVVDITNYVLLETGQPLHAFDLDKLDEKRIVVRRATHGESIKTLDGVDRKLTDAMLVIADANAPQAIAGIMGGHDSEVGEGTTRLLLESAFFAPTSIRKTSRKLSIISEASQRFQRGADPEMVPAAARRAAGLLQKIAGAQIAKGILDAYPTPLPKRTLSLRYDRTAALLGIHIPREMQRSSLSALGFSLIGQDNNTCGWEVPSWRHDVAHEADLIEEIARLYGYDKIPVTLPSIPSVEEVFAPLDAEFRKLRRFLVTLKLTELQSWTFSNQEEVDKLNLTERYPAMITLENPLSERQATMRITLLPGILKAAAHNLHHGAATLALFEEGPVYLANNDGDLQEQLPRLAILLGGKTDHKHWGQPLQDFDFFHLKGLVEHIFDYFKVTPTFENATFGPFQEGQTARIKHGDETLGYLGKVNYSVLKDFDIDTNIFALEFDLNPLITAHKKHQQFDNIPNFPPSRRDLAIIVSRDIQSGQLLETARSAGAKHLKTIDIFDIYTGKQIPQNQKSIALSLVFQSANRTLTDKETQKSYNKILRSLQTEHGAVLR